MTSNGCDCKKCEITADFTLATGDMVTITKCTQIKTIPCPSFKTCNVLKLIHGNSTQEITYASMTDMRLDVNTMIAWRRI